MKRLIITLIISLVGISTYAQKPAVFMPAFKFYTAQNRGFTKEQVSPGKATLVVFFDGTCGHCQKVMTILAREHEALAQANVLLVSLDEFKTINYFMEHYGKALIGKRNVTLLQDRDHVFIPLFKPTKYPAMFVYGADQRLRIYSSDDTDIDKVLNMLK